MNTLMGDYGFVVINGDLKAKIDCCTMGHDSDRQEIERVWS